MSNEYLERIAIALEAIEENQASTITWQQMLDDLEATLGIGNAFYLLAKAFSDMFPSLKNIKLDPWPLVVATWRTRTFEAPLLASLVGMNTSLAAMAAATVGGKTMELVRTIATVFGSVNALYAEIRDAILGDFNVLDFLLSLINAFIPDAEGGDGGPDPDADPENRILVQTTNNVINNQSLSVDCGGGGCGCIADGGTDIQDVNDSANTPIPGPADPLPPGFPTRPDYDEYRCTAAYYIIRSYIGTLRNWGALTGVTGALTVALIASVVLLIIPPIGLAIIVGALAGLAAIDLTLFSNLTTIANDLENIIDDIACDLYDAADTSAAVAVISNAADSIIDGLALGSNTDTFKTICQNLISNEACKLLFEKDPVVEALPSEDCSGCGVPPLWQVEPVGGQFPTVVSGDLGTSAVIQSAYADLFGAFRNFVTVATTTHPANLYVKIISIPEGYTGNVTCEIYVSDVLSESFPNVSLGSLVGLTRTCSSVHIRGEVPNMDDMFQVEFDFIA